MERDTGKDVGYLVEPTCLSDFELYSGKGFDNMRASINPVMRCPASMHVTYRKNLIVSLVILLYRTWSLLAMRLTSNVLQMRENNNAGHDRFCTNDLVEVIDVWKDVLKPGILSHIICSGTHFGPWFQALARKPKYERRESNGEVYFSRKEENTKSVCYLNAISSCIYYTPPNMRFRLCLAVQEPYHRKVAEDWIYIHFEGTHYCGQEFSHIPMAQRYGEAHRANRWQINTMSQVSYLIPEEKVIIVDAERSTTSLMMCYVRKSLS